MEVNNLEFWDNAYRNNAPALLGVLRRYVREVGIAQDLLHEVFITAINKYGSYSGKGSFEGWLHRITVNTALMYLRNEKNKQVVMDVETWQTASLSVMDENDMNNEQSDDARIAIETAGFSNEDLLNAIDRLPEHHKLVFNMYVIDDFSHKQIAAELNISLGTSKSHLARARKKIQQFLYNDALNRNKIKDRKWVSALVLLFPVKKHYIDKLYHDGLAHFTILPTGDTEFLVAALNQHTTMSASSAITPSMATIVSPTTATFWGSKLSYITVSCGVAAITGTVCWLLTGGSNSTYADNNDIMNNAVIASDTITYLHDPIEENTAIFNAAGYDNSVPAEPVFTKASENEEPFFQDNPKEIEQITFTSDSSSEKTVEPVIIKKQIIQHQTVVVRDTIYITE